jgi:procollagen-lysine,2-oxoglutarate 5-dioxygenase
MSSNIRVITVATEKTDGLARLRASAVKHGINLEVLGLDGHWTGGNISRLENPGGGQKINFVKQYIKSLDNDTVIIFVDGYDVVFMGPLWAIMEKYKSLKHKVLFTAERTCWPDTSLSKRYPHVNSEYKFLNSGTFVAEVGELKKITEEEINNTDDDQLYYSLRFLSNSFDMGLDYECKLFQPTEGCWSDVEYIHEEKEELTNTVFGTKPLVMHGNGSPRAKVFFNRVCDYVLREPTNEKEHSRDCSISMFVFAKSHDDLEAFVLGLVHLNYPKDKISVYFCSTRDRLSKKAVSLLTEFKSFTFKESQIGPEQRDEALRYASELDDDYVFFIDDNCILENPYTLENMMRANKNIISPVLLVKDTWTTTFWRGVDDAGWYEEFKDFFNIADRSHKGLWNCPHASSCILMKKDFVKKSLGKFSLNYDDNKGDYITFCANLRDSGDFIYVDNREIYGRLSSG